MLVAWRRVVEHADVEAVREVDGVLGAGDVDLRVALLVRSHVVDGGEVEEVVDAREVALHAELGLREVADDRLDPVGVTPALDELGELVARALAHEDVDVTFALEQALHEVTSDEPGGTSDEVGRQRNLPP